LQSIQQTKQSAKKITKTGILIADGKTFTVKKFRSTIDQKKIKFNSLTKEKNLRKVVNKTVIETKMDKSQDKVNRIVNDKATVECIESSGINSEKENIIVETVGTTPIRKRTGRKALKRTINTPIRFRENKTRERKTKKKLEEILFLMG